MINILDKATTLGSILKGQELPCKVIYEGNACFWVTGFNKDNDAVMKPRKGSIDADRTCKQNINAKGDWALGWGEDE